MDRPGGSPVAVKAGLSPAAAWVAGPCRPTGLPATVLWLPGDRTAIVPCTYSVKDSDAGTTGELADGVTVTAYAPGADAVPEIRPPGVMDRPAGRPVAEYVTGCPASALSERTWIATALPARGCRAP